MSATSHTGHSAGAGYAQRGPPDTGQTPSRPCSWPNLLRPGSPPPGAATVTTRVHRCILLRLNCTRPGSGQHRERCPQTTRLQSSWTGGISCPHATPFCSRRALAARPFVPLRPSLGTARATPAPSYRRAGLCGRCGATRLCPARATSAPRECLPDDARPRAAGDLGRLFCVPLCAFT